MNDTSYLNVYLQDHYAGAVAETALFHRVAGTHGDSQARKAVAEMATQVEEDRSELASIMRSLQIPHSLPKQALGWLGEKVCRLKANGRVLRRSPLTDVVELEALSLAVKGKTLGLKALLAAAVAETNVDQRRVQALLDRAQVQQVRLEELRLACASEVFGPGRGQAVR